MKTSKFIQIDPKVLMEYIYEDSFLTSENYIVTHDLNQNLRSFAPKDIEGSNNRYSNQLVLLDPIRNKYGVRDSVKYNFLQDREYTQNLPVHYDRVKLHFPIDFNFGEYIGCYLKIYVMDHNNNELIGLSNYYFDKQNQHRFNNELQLSTPPHTLNGMLWGKYIEVAFPSPNNISLQRTNNIANSNSINYNISGGVGISNTSPIMVEFGFITLKEIINGTTTYLLRAPYQTSVPQVPDYENLSVNIESSPDGDWFDIYGIYNGTSSEFNKWLRVSQQSGKSYYIEYVITMFEENIKGKSLTTVITDDFNEKIEYRPIIKYSSTTAAIEVIMRIIDRVDDSIITRIASYGMLPDEISKYSRNLVRIAVNGIKTPKIYNMRSGGSLLDAFNGLNNRKNTDGMNSNLFGNDIQTVKVPYPILINSNNIVAKSTSAIVESKLWYGMGKLKIIVNPFDNIFKFTLAKDVKSLTRYSAPTLSVDVKDEYQSPPLVAKQASGAQLTNFTGQIEYFDLMNVGTLHLHFKGRSKDIKTVLYRKSGEIDLKNGSIVFKLDKNRVNDVRQVYESKVNMFYITSTNEDTNETTVLYEGTFMMSDSVEYVEEMTQSYESELNNNLEDTGISINIDRDLSNETAIVTRKTIKD